MATITATAGGTTSNSYVTMSEADAYVDGRLYPSTWDDASTDDRTRALITATKMLDYKVVWNGLKPNTTQALEWPRNLVYDEDGYLVDSASIPVFIQDATVELAIGLLKEDLVSNYDTRKLEQIKAGPINLKFNDQYNRNMFPDVVMEIIRPYGDFRSRDGASNIKVERL